MATALSRVEKILQSKIDGTSYTDPPLSRVEKLLIDLNTSGGGGGDVPQDILNDIKNLQRGVTDLADMVHDLFYFAENIYDHAILDESAPAYVSMFKPKDDPSDPQ